MKAGFGSVDITPRLGVQLVGYGPYRNRASQSILAPLLARVMAVADGPRRALLVNLELCGTPHDQAARIRDAIARRMGCDPEQVFVSVTHTHSGPSLGGMIGWGAPDPMYVETLPARVADAAEKACGALKPVEWRYAEVPCEGIAVNRETDAGGWSLKQDPLSVRLSPKWRPARPQDTDPTLRVLAAFSGKKLIGVLHHFGCHAVVGSEQTFDVHGDFVGLASQQIEKACPGATAIFLPGAIGDINPPVCHRAKAETHRALKVLSKKYAGVIQRGVTAAQPIDVDDFKSVRRDVKFSRKPWTATFLRERIRKLEAVFAARGATDSTVVGTPPLHTHGQEMVRLESARQILSQCRGEVAPHAPVSVHGFRIGPVALLGVGLEVFHSLQKPIVAGSPHPHTWVVSLVGGLGYAPDARACAKEGYTDDLVPAIAAELPYAKIYEEVPRELVKLARDL